MDMDFGHVQNESTDRGSEPTLREGAKNSLSLIQLKDVGPIMSRDITVIRSIMSAPKKTKFVDIEDVLLSNDDLECLIKADMFLHDGVRPIASLCIQ